MRRLVRIIKKMHWKDLISPLIFLIMLMPAGIFRLRNKLTQRRLWLIAEEGEARDNGYYFYKYVREKHPKDFCFYAVKTKSAGYKKIAKLGNVIKFGSLKHWLYYMAADLNISSQVGGNPSSLFWYFVHVVLGLYQNRVFLQHGVIMNDVAALYYKRTKFKYFICGAKLEYEEILGEYGYPFGSVVLTGLPRWDYLKNKTVSEKSILIMPTWRKYLEHENEMQFKKSAYYKAWNTLLNDKAFVGFVEKHNINVYFYPHRNMQSKLNAFEFSSDKIKPVSMNEDIALYFSKCDLMITDYSSVTFDFAFLDKPVVYYQFDQKDFRLNQHDEGYFSYERNGFGPVLKSNNDVVHEVQKIVKDNFEIDSEYNERIRSFFTLHDRQNCKRIYGALG